MKLMIDSSHVLVVGQITHNLPAFHLALEATSCAAEASWARFACNAIFESLLTKCNNDDKMKYKKQRFKLYNVRVQNIFKTFLGTISSILFIERQCHEDVDSGNQ